MLILKNKNNKYNSRVLIIRTKEIKFAFLRKFLQKMFVVFLKLHFFAPLKNL